MEGKGSSRVAANKQPVREKTRFAGVYVRKIMNRHTGKADTAFDITYKDQNGKKVWVFIGYGSNGVNAGFASQRRGAILDGFTKGEKPKRQSPGANMAFAEGWEVFQEKWLPNLARPHDEKSRYKMHIKPHLAHRKMASITLLDLEEMKTAMLRKGLAKATVRMVLSDIRRIYRKLALLGIYSGPIPTEGLVMPKLDNERTRFLTRDEATTLLADLKTKSETWHDVAFISLHTGMRKGEILNLRGENIDFANGRILIRISKTKSRTIPITDELRHLLLAIAPNDPTAYLFRKRTGSPHVVIGSDADKSFVRAVKDCGLNDGITDPLNKVVFHTLRHTFASWLAIEGVPLHNIGQLLGHTSTQMTRRYAHLCPDMQKDIAAKIGEIMRRPKGGRGATAGHVFSASETPDTSE